MKTEFDGDEVHEEQPPPRGKEYVDIYYFFPIFLDFILLHNFRCIYFILIDNRIYFLYIYVYIHILIYFFLAIKRYFLFYKYIF